MRKVNTKGFRKTSETLAECFLENASWQAKERARVEAEMVKQSTQEYVTRRFTTVLRNFSF